MKIKFLNFAIDYLVIIFAHEALESPVSLVDILPLAMGRK